MKHLKKITQIFLVFAVAILFSCNSDDDNQSNDTSLSANIIGVWELVSIVTNGETSDEGTECLDTVTITATTYDYTERFDFNDGNGCMVISGVATPEPFFLNQNNFFVTDDGESFNYQIIEVTLTTLKLQETYTENGETITDIEIYNRVE